MWLCERSVHATIYACARAILNLTPQPFYVCRPYNSGRPAGLPRSWRSCYHPCICTFITLIIMYIVHTMLIFLNPSIARYSCPCFSSRACAISRICHLLCWTTSRRWSGFRHWRSPDPAFRVSVQRQHLLVSVWSLTTFVFHRPTWRSVYFLVSGLAILCIIGAVFIIDADHPSIEQDKRIDWLGALFVTAGLVLVVFVLSDGEIAPNKWATPCKSST